MPKVYVSADLPLEDALRIFSQQVKKSEVLQTLKAHESFLNKREKRKLKSDNAAKRRK